MALQDSHRTPSGRFRNPWPDSRPRSFSEFLRWALIERPGRVRSPGPAIMPMATPEFPQRGELGDLVVTWVGHSSFLVQIGGVNVLLDPVWGERASPVHFAGPKRLVPPGIPFESLPPIDLVALSHDHYDHLDLDTVRRILVAHPTARWLAPLGTGAWLARRGANVVAELDWWESTSALGLRVTSTPAQHFSGRRIGNRDSTLWCGWAIRSDAHAVFFAGDTGRHPEFAEIAMRLGPFDAALMPIGAYEPRWFMHPVHVAPDEAVDAYAQILRANAGQPCTFVGMHWGTFMLTDEPMDEPPRLTREAWRRAGFDHDRLWIPVHGETRRL